MGKCSSWNGANGYYILDPTLQDCYSLGTARYRQVGGCGLIWLKFSYWYGTIEMCNFQIESKLFSALQSAASPDQVSDWFMTSRARDVMEPSLMVVSVANIDDCGECLWISHMARYKPL